VTFAPVDGTETSDSEMDAPPDEEIVAPPVEEENAAEGTEAVTPEATSEEDASAPETSGNEMFTEEAPTEEAPTEEAPTEEAPTEEAPTEEALAAQDITESLPFVIAAQGALTVETTVRPTWLALTATENGDVLLTGTPQETDEGEHPVELIATDAAGVVITQSYTITVELDPNPFRVEALQFVTDEDTLLEGVLTAEHVEGDALLFGMAREPEHGAILAIDEASGAFTYEPLADFYGEDEFAIHISDSLQREITALVAITVNPINDAPRIEMEDVYTVTVGDNVELPVIVTDVEGDPVTITVESLPLDLVYLEPGSVELDSVEPDSVELESPEPGSAEPDALEPDALQSDALQSGGVISGAVALDAAESSPYTVQITASDGEGSASQMAITWVVEPAPTEGEYNGETDAGAGEEETPGADQTPSEEAAVEQPPAAEIVTLAADAATRALPGSAAFSAYVWQTPVEIGDCPNVAAVMAPASLSADASLFDDAAASNLADAPSLGFDVELAAGDYALLVCGCAPTYADAERISLPVFNQALFAGIDGVTLLTDDGAPVPLSGFAASPGFTWQALLDDAASSPAILSVAGDGLHSVDLWMADDGVLVSAVAVVPAVSLDELSTMVGQVCAGNE
jgi:hypothetical protein